MVTDQEIAKGVETLLRQSDPNAVTSLNGVVQQLEAKLGLDLSHKAGFIQDQISLLLRAHPTAHVVTTTQQLQPPHQPQQTLAKDNFALPHQSQFSLPPQQFSPHFALHTHHHHPHPQLPQELNFRQSHRSPSPAPATQTPQLQPHSNVVKPEGFSQNPAEVPKERFGHLYIYFQSSCLSFLGFKVVSISG